eukprot:4370549-Pleurochrysis_carterae.AAC.1
MFDEQRRRRTGSDPPPPHPTPQPSLASRWPVLSCIRAAPSLWPHFKLFRACTPTHKGVERANTRVALARGARLSAPVPVRILRRE